MNKKEKLVSKIDNNSIKILEYQEKIKCLQKENLKLKKDLSNLKEKEILNLIKEKNLDIQDVYNILNN